MKNVILNFRIVVLMMISCAAAGAAGGPVAQAAGRVNPTEEIEKALQQARLWDEKEDAAAEKILAYFYEKAVRYEKASGKENSLLAASFYSLTAQTLLDYYRSYGAAEDFRVGMMNGEMPEPNIRVDFENADSWTKRDFYRAVNAFLEKSCALSVSENNPETLASFAPALRLWDSTLSCYTPDITLALHYRALQLWGEMSRKVGIGMETGVGPAAARCRARLLSLGERRALCDWDLHYLLFLRDRDSIDHNEYTHRLLQLEQTYPDLPLAADMLYLLADQAQGPHARQAEDYARRADAYTNSWGAHNSRILLHDLLSPSFSLSMKRVQTPAAPVEVDFEAKNCQAVFYSIFRLSQNQVEDVLTRGFHEDVVNGLMGRNPQWKRVDLQADTTGNGKFLLPSMPKGAYVLACRLDSANKSTSFLFFQVSESAYFGYPTDHHRQTWEMLCVTGKDGKLAPASLCAFTETYNYKKRRTDFELRRLLKADKNGIFTLDSTLLTNKKSGEAFWLRFDRKDDTLWVENPLYVAAKAEPRKSLARGEIRFFPDLPVYRKGDSVHMAVWVSDTPSSVRFSLRDPERKTRLTIDGTHRNGLIRLDFTMPEEGRAGLWSLYTKDYNYSFSFAVEEYVRPNFEIVLENVPLQAVRDSFRIEGKAAYLSGENLRWASVNYTVFKTAYSYGHRFYRVPARQKIAEFLLTKGGTQTDDNGHFTFRFAQDTTLLNDAPFWVYEVVCEGVDAGGETQVARAFIPLKTRYTLQAEGEELWVSNNGKWIGDPKPIEVFMNGINPDDTWQLLDSTMLMPRHDWASGKHTLTFSAIAPNGKIISVTKEIRVEKCGEKASDFFLKADGVYKNNARFAVGNPCENALLFRFRIEDAAQNAVTLEKLLPSGGGIWEIPCPNLNPQSGWTLSAFALYEGKSVSEETTLTPPRPVREMDFSMRRASEANTPRSGQSDTLFFESPAGTAEGAEPQALIVSMYDQSLDAFSPNGALWPSALLAPYPKAPASAWSGALCSDRSVWLFLHGPSHPDTYLEYPALPANLKWDGLFRIRMHHRMHIRGTGASLSMSKNSDGATEEDAVETSQSEIEASQNEDETENLTVREDFSPGVFFALPEWKATDNGYKAVFPFNHPDYFGRFKIRAFGFDNRLYANYKEQLVEVSNPLMLYPQTPRFLMVDDSAVLSCRFVTQEQGTLRIQLTATAIYQDGSRHLLASEQYTYTPRKQGRLSSFELPIRVNTQCTKILFLCTAYLTLDKDSTQVSDRVRTEIPVVEGDIKLCEYYPFVLLPAQKNELKPDFSFACDSIHLTLNHPSQSLPTTVLAEKEFDSCKTALQTVEKMASLCLAQKPWRHLWPVLQKFSQPGGGYSWLAQGPASVDITLSVLETLAYIPQNEFSTLRDKRDVTKSLEFLAKKLRISDTNDVQLSPFSLRFLYVLSYWKREASSLRLQNEVSLYRRAALQNLDKITLEQRAMLLSYLLSEKRYDEARVVLANLQRLALFDPVQGMYWKREALGDNPGRRMRTMSAIAHAFSYAASLKDFASESGRDSLYHQYTQILAWFPAQKQSLDFSRPNGNGVGTRELLAWASASLPATQATAQTARKPQTAHGIDTLIAANQLNAFITQLTSTETAPTQVRFGTLRACTTQKTRTAKAYKGNGDLTVSLTYAPPANGYNSYPCGDIIEVAAEIKAKRDFNYVHLKLPRPAGLEWEDTHSGFTAHSKTFYYKDVDIKNTDCFFEFLPKGTYRIFYRLKAQNDGKYTQPPVSVLSENESTFGSHSSAKVIGVSVGRGLLMNTELCD